MNLDLDNFKGSWLGNRWKGLVADARQREPTDTRFVVSQRKILAGSNEPWELRITPLRPLPAGASIAVELPIGSGGCRNWSEPAAIRKLVTDSDRAFYSCRLEPARGASLAHKLYTRGAFGTVIEIAVSEGVIGPGSAICLSINDPLAGKTFISAPQRPGPFPIYVLEWRKDLDWRCPPKWPALDVDVGPAEFLSVICKSTVTVGEAITGAVSGRAGGDSSNAPSAIPAPMINLGGSGVTLASIRPCAARPEIHLVCSTPLAASLPTAGRCTATAGSLPAATSNPILTVTDGQHRHFWGDLHFHSNLSEGYGEPQAVMEWARDVSRLDFACLNEHLEDRLAYVRPWNEAKWQRLLDVVRDFTRAGDFIALPGFELNGDVNCYFENRAEPFHPWDNMSWDDITEILRGLRARSDVLIGYHKPGAVGAYLDHAPLPDLLEVVQEKRKPGEGISRFVRAGSRVAFTGNSDSHMGLPGSPCAGHGWKSQTGLTCVLAQELSHAAVFAALREGRSYATMGQRSLLQFRVNDQWMGSVVNRTRHDGTVRVEAKIWPDQPLVRAQVYRNFQLWKEWTGSQDDCVRLEWEDSSPIEPACMYHLETEEADGRRAWVSPVHVCSAG